MTTPNINITPTFTNIASGLTGASAVQNIGAADIYLSVGGSTADQVLLVRGAFLAYLGGALYAATASGLTGTLAVLSGSLGMAPPAALSGSITLNSSGVTNSNTWVAGSNVSATNPMPVYDGYQPAVTTTWTSATAANTAQTSSTAGYDVVIVTLIGSSLATGQLVFEVYDGASWLAVKAPSILDYTTSGATIPLSGTINKGFQVSVAGFPQFRVRLATALTAGTLLVTSLVSGAPDVSLVTVGLDPSQPLPAGNNTLGGVSVGNQLLNTTVNPQLVASGTASAASAAVSAAASFIVINPTVDSWVKVCQTGSGATAAVNTGGNIFLAAGSQSYPFRVVPSTTTVAAIANNASQTGFITITEGQ